MYHSSQKFQRRQRISRLGLEREKAFSKIVHTQKIPLLIHPHFLRTHMAGQVDLAVIGKELGIIYEIKGAAGASAKQRKRLRGAAQLLGEIFNRSFLIKTVCFQANSTTNFDIT